MHWKLTLRPPPLRRLQVDLFGLEVFLHVYHTPVRGKSTHYTLLRSTEKLTAHATLQLY
jgi:hypothetical protein